MQVAVAYKMPMIKGYIFAHSKLECPYFREGLKNSGNFHYGPEPLPPPLPLSGKKMLLAKNDLHVICMIRIHE